MGQASGREGSGVLVTWISFRASTVPMWVRAAGSSTFHWREMLQQVGGITKSGDANPMLIDNVGLHWIGGSPSMKQGTEKRCSEARILGRHRSQRKKSGKRAVRGVTFLKQARSERMGTWMTHGRCWMHDLGTELSDQEEGRNALCSGKLST